MTNYQKRITHKLERNGYWIISAEKNEITIGYETAVFPLCFTSWAAVTRWLNEVSVC